MSKHRDKYAWKNKGGRSCRRSDGTPKRPFPSRERAEEAVSLGDSVGKRLRCYECWACGQWHLATVQEPVDIP